MAAAAACSSASLCFRWKKACFACFECCALCRIKWILAQCGVFTTLSPSPETLFSVAARTENENRVSLAAEQTRRAGGCREADLHNMECTCCFLQIRAHPHTPGPGPRAVWLEIRLQLRLIEKSSCQLCSCSSWWRFLFSPSVCGQTLKSFHHFYVFSNEKILSKVFLQSKSFVLFIMRWTVSWCASLTFSY